MEPIDWLSKTRAWVQSNEGRKRRRYFDSKGIPSVGIGFNLERDDMPAKMAALGADWKAIVDGTGELTDQQVDTLFDWTFAEALAYARSLCPNFDELLPQAQTVLVDMSFEMSTRLKGFVRMRAAIAAKDYEAMILEMRLSKYAKDVPSRLAKNVALIEAALPPSPEGSV